MNHKTRVELFRDILGKYKVPVDVRNDLIERWEQDVGKHYEAGYDAAATKIADTLQNCIPSKATNVPDARVQGAWRDAAQIAVNHIGGRAKT